MSGEMAASAEERPPEAVADSRRKLVGDGMAIAAYAFPVGLVFGLAALQAHYSLIDVVANSVVAFAGGAQFAAAGMVKDGASWLAIAGVTLLVNARHLLYSAATGPYTAARSRKERVLMAHFLTDETFALSLAHFRRIRAFDAPGYWIAAMAIFIPWTTGSALGYVAGGAVDVNRLGLDVAFPAAMAGLSLGMVSGRRDVAAALGAVAVAVPLGLAAGASVGLVAGAVVGPLIGLAMPEAGGGAGTVDAAGGTGSVDGAGPAHERASEAGLP
jgi:4-azaleucine resistance transporter AzlC